MFKQISFFLLIAITLVLSNVDSAFAQTPVPPLPPGPNTFIETFSGSPKNPDGTYANDPPKPLNSPRWDVAVHDSGNREPPQKEVAAGHGMNCEPPVEDITKAASSTNKLVNHQTDGSFGQAVFVCRDHVMTATAASGYGVIYITPNHMVDFSQGEAIIRWNMSTLRNSERDWIDVWISPFEEHLQLPFQESGQDLQGPPRRAVHVFMKNEMNSLCPYVYVNGLEIEHNVAGENCSEGSRYDQFEGFPFMSAARRDTFEIRISRTHMKIGMPGYNSYWYDHDLAQPLDWTRGVVQFGHHSYTPDKGTFWKNPTSGIATETTWHWDDFNISPAIPFTIIKGDKRYVAGSEGSLSVPASTVTFTQPAPANSFLRFSAFGPRDLIEYSTNGGTSWQKAQIPFQDNDCCHITNYWTPVPAGTTQVRFRSPQMGSLWNSNVIKDISIFSTTAGPTTPSITSSPTQTPSTPSPTITRKPGNCDGLETLDNDIDIFDYNIAVGSFGSTTDLRCDFAAPFGEITIFDYNIVIGNFGT